jgi:predicted GNAT family acetyltransferase
MRSLISFDEYLYICGKSKKKMIDIRLANKFDSLAIAEFQICMAKETENLKLDKDTVNKGINALFSDPEKGKYYVADDNGKPVASMLITYEWSDWRNSWIYWIQSVYVLPEYRKKGIFKLMYNHIVDSITDNNKVSGLRLYVDTTNAIARKVYSNIGMNGDHYQVFEWMK